MNWLLDFDELVGDEGDDKPIEELFKVELEFDGLTGFRSTCWKISWEIS